MSAQSVINTLLAAGVPVPDTFAATARRYDQAVSVLATFDKPRWSDEEVAAELLLHRDHPLDMRDLLVTAALPYALAAGGPQAAAYMVRPGVKDQIARQWLATIIAHRPALLEQLQPLWRAAGVALVDLVGRYPAGDSDAVLAAGDDAIAAYRQRDPLVAKVHNVGAAAFNLNGGVQLDPPNGYGLGRTIGGHRKGVPDLLTLFDVTPQDWPSTKEADRAGWEQVARVAAPLGPDVWTLTDPDGAQQRHQVILEHQAAEQKRLDAEADRLSREAWTKTPDGQKMTSLFKHYTT